MWESVVCKIFVLITRIANLKSTQQASKQKSILHHQLIK